MRACMNITVDHFRSYGTFTISCLLSSIYFCSVMYGKTCIMHYVAFLVNLGGLLFILRWRGLNENNRPFPIPNLGTVFASLHLDSSYGPFYFTGMVTKLYYAVLFLILLCDFMTYYYPLLSKCYCYSLSIYDFLICSICKVW